MLIGVTRGLLNSLTPMLIGVILLSWNSCQTTQRSVDTGVEPGILVTCEPTKIKLAPDVGWFSPVDDPNLREAVRGCIRNYGPDSCLVLFIKRGERNYHAICRKK